MRHGIFYVFFSVIVALDVLAHRYLYIRLFRDPGWPDAVRQAGLVLCVLLAVLMPAGIILSRSLPRAWAQPLAHASFAWMGTAFYLLLVLFAVDLARWVTEAALHVGNLFAGGAGAPTEGTLPSPERRAVLQQATADMPPSVASSVNRELSRT